jgi:hypothetical protein
MITSPRNFGHEKARYGCITSLNVSCKTTVPGGFFSEAFYSLNIFECVLHDNYLQLVMHFKSKTSLCSGNSQSKYFLSTMTFRADFQAEKVSKPTTMQRT